MAEPNHESEDHLRLAKGFLATATISKLASEYEVRNALSRSYYAIFHVCNAWLARRRIPSDRRERHGNLQKEIAHARGEQAKTNLKNLYILREQADYRADWISRQYSGNLEQFRDSAFFILLRARDEFRYYERLIEETSLETGV